MSGDLYCQRHGPYHASLGQCPACARERYFPPEPIPQDELETEVWGGHGRPASGAPDEQITYPRSGTRSYAAEEQVTAWPKRRQDGWQDDEELPDWPGSGRGEENLDETVLVRARTGLLGFLIVKEGRHRGQVHCVSHGTTIGRRSAELVLRDPNVCPLHAKLTVEDGQFFIWDFGSENGTFVNDQRIRQATPLHENDVVKMGDCVFVLKTLE